MNDAFAAMRAGLMSRGLIEVRNGEHRITAEGHAWIDEQMHALARSEAENDRDGPRVFWPHIGRNSRAVLR